MPRLCLLFTLMMTVYPLQGAVKIACVGDSITEGSGLSNPGAESYPARLQRLLGTNNFAVRNFGVSGRTLLKKGDFPYWNESAYTQSRNFAPDIVIIQLGTNDSKPYNWRYGTNYISDYRDLIAVYRGLSSAPKIYLCTPCPVYAAGAYDISPGVVRTNIAPQVRNLAAELAFPLIDLHLRMTNSTWFPDTVHPNSKGMTAMAAVMFESIMGGLPNEPRPSLLVERLAGNRVLLTWPFRWGGLIPRSTTLLKDSKTAWTVLETVTPYGDGAWIRQTNTLVLTGQRYFQLAQP